MKDINSIEFQNLCSIIRELAKKDDSSYDSIINRFCKRDTTPTPDIIKETNQLLELGLQVGKLKIDLKRKYKVCDSINVIEVKYYQVICDAIEAIISNNKAPTISNIAGYVGRKYLMKQTQAMNIVEPILKAGIDQGLFVSFKGFYTLPKEE